MEEKSKFRVYFEKLKKIWKDKRYRSLIILLLYFIFFMIIFIFLQSSDNQTIKNYEKIIEFKNYTNYEFVMDISLNDSIYNIKGKRYNNNYEFMNGEQIFNMDNLEIIESNLDQNIINAFNYTPNFIDNLIDNASFISEKTIIADKQVIKEYYLNLDIFLQILDVNLINYNHNDCILINTSEFDKKIIKVELDLSNFYKNLEESYNDYKITINYSNINGVEEF